MIPELKKSSEHKMQKSLEALKADLGKVRTGRAHTGILDHVMVEYYGSPVDSDLGLNPSPQGELIRVPMPALTEERRRDLIKVIKHEGENAKVAIRNLRRDAITHLKDALKKKEISEDDERRALDDMQRLTDRYVAEVDRALADKEKDLMAI